MNILGAHIILMIGASGPPQPVPFEISQALKDVNVSHNDQGSSGFQISFHIGRSGPLDLIDYALLRSPLLKPFNRVILLVSFALVPEVLMDGIITNIQMSPSEEPGASTLTITGEDVSVMMDLEQKSQSFPVLSDYLKVLKIIGQYSADYGLVPPLPPIDIAPMIPDNPFEQILQQPRNLTDRGYIQELAGRYGYVFYVTPGPLPLVNTVHWGIPDRLTIPQPALSVNMGYASNVKSINFSYDALKPQEVSFANDDNSTEVVDSPSYTSMIPLARDRAKARKKISLTGFFGDDAKTQAQGMVDSSFESVVTANGELDALRYQRLLQPRGLVGLRGAGDSYDGFYYVKSVSHSISIGQYTQSFSLTREGTGTITPFIIP
jgi:hypothetical protein